MKFRSNRQLEQSTKFLEQKIVQFDESGGGIDRLRDDNNQTSIIDNNNNHLISSSRSLFVQSMSKKNGLGVSGLSNLGNTCFFNSVLQNLSQTRLLTELLRENLEGALPYQIHIKHNPDYDSDLTDCDESQIVEKPTDSPEKKPPSKPHRSVRVKELSLEVKEGPGLLTRRLHDVIKNMRSASSGVVNPNELFKPVCEKVPSFKGFQQQDSHELLRSLLDAVKSEEHKRRQAAILKSFGVTNKEATKVDELTKMKIKRYGRLSSYTLIDALFGGHLLSSVVCDECHSCMQRLEAFLDLSVPIVDDESSKLELEESFRRRPGRACKKVDTPVKSSAKKSTPPPPLTTDSEDTRATKSKKEDFLVDSSSVDTSKMSKHQLKKLQKQTKKSQRNKKGGKNQSESKDDEQQVEAVSETKSEGNASSEKNQGEVSNSNCDGDTGENSSSSQTAQSSSTHTVTESSPSPQTESTTTSLNDLEQKLVKLDLNQQENAAENDVDEESKKEEKTTEKPSSESEEEEEEEEENVAGNDYSLGSFNKLKLEAMKRYRELPDQSTSSDLEQCLAKFTSIESLSDKIVCDECTRRTRVKTYTTAAKQYLLCEMPAMLTIHLKRFQQHGVHLAKSNKFVSFPAVLDMSPYASRMCVVNGGGGNEETIFNDDGHHRFIYRLYGLVEHSGRLNSGHYTACVRMLNDDAAGDMDDEAKRRRMAFLSAHRLCNFNKIIQNWSSSKNSQIEKKIKSNGSTRNVSASVESNDRWFYVSDSQVKEISFGAVQKSQAYLLFYERIQ